MNTPPTAPKAGDRIRSGFMAEVVRYLKSITPIAGSNVRLRRTPNGTVISADKDIQKASRDIPWSFYCEEDASGNRTGGWKNCMLQLGYFDVYRSIDLLKLLEREESAKRITGEDKTGDGEYAVKCDLNNRTVSIENSSADGWQKDNFDIDNNVIWIYIGTVTDGKLEHARHQNPVVYIYQ